MFYEVKIKCIVSNSLNNYKYHILIYDRKNKLIEKIYITKKEEQTVMLKSGVYKVIVLSNCNLTPHVYSRKIIVNKNSNNKFNFYFVDNKNRRPITFKLIDYNYNLPITKGEIILWQNHIQ